MEKAIYYREHYYKLPDGVDFDAFKAGLPSEVELTELCENYGQTGPRDLGISLAPYFISGYSKGAEKVKIDVPYEVYPVDVEILTQEEYNTRLREVMCEHCPGCKGYKPLSNNVRSLNGHFDEITLDKICFYRWETNPSPRFFRHMLWWCGGFWRHFSPLKNTPEWILNDIKSRFHMKYESGEFSAENKNLFVVTHKKDFFLSVLTRIYSEYIESWLDYTEFRLKDSDETTFTEDDVQALLTEGKIEKFRKECKKYGVSLAILEFPESEREEIERSFAEPVKHNLFYPVCRADGKTYYIMTDTPVAMKELYFRFPMLEHYGATVTVYSQADTRTYTIGREMKYTHNGVEN
ncbi:MAG: hypothetical protein IJX27_09135 [Clostridia bacterium]|nr:hypothetical protein [Clostridia bacterium]